MIVVYAQELRHEKELADNVRQVDELAEEVENDKVVAEAFACPEEKEAEPAANVVVDAVLVAPVVLFGLDEGADVAGEELHEFLALGELLNGFVFYGRVHVVVDLDAAFVVQRSP